MVTAVAQCLQQLTVSADTPVAVPGAANLSDLPLIELPATGDTNDLLAVIISGDGGWANIDKKLGEYFSSQGISVVGLNSLKYFWTRRTPDGASMDLLRIISHYSDAWNKGQGAAGRLLARRGRIALYDQSIAGSSAVAKWLG